MEGSVPENYGCEANHHLHEEPMLEVQVTQSVALQTGTLARSPRTATHRGTYNCIDDAVQDGSKDDISAAFSSTLMRMPIRTPVHANPNVAVLALASQGVALRCLLLHQKRLAQTGAR